MQGVEKIMAARPRNKPNRTLPDHLYHDPVRGTYRFKLVNGRRITLGSDRIAAIEIAREYNLRMRPAAGVGVDDLIRMTGGINGEAAPLAEHVDRLLERIIHDEQPAGDTLSTFKNDAERCKEFFVAVPACDITLEHVNAYLDKYHPVASANVYNRKISWLKKLFAYAMDESLMLENPAARKKMKRTSKKERRRLSLDDFKQIRASAPLWMRTAMDLALQCAQARLEVSRIRYSIKKPKEGVCGCVWFDGEQGGIWGMLYIHRQKVADKEASHVAIPIGTELKRIIDESRDNIASPYVVHRVPDRANKRSKETDHPTQLAPDYLSRSFSKLRDQVGVAADLPELQRPTFHEIRALAAHLFDMQGINPQARMAHTDSDSTKIYTRDHVEWVEVPHAEIRLNAG